MPHFLFDQLLTAQLVSPKLVTLSFHHFWKQIVNVWAMTNPDFRQMKLLEERTNKKCYSYHYQGVFFVITEFLPLVDTIPLPTFVISNLKDFSHVTERINFGIFVGRRKEKKKKRKKKTCMTRLFLFTWSQANLFNSYIYIKIVRTQHILKEFKRKENLNFSNFGIFYIFEGRIWNEITIRN